MSLRNHYENLDQYAMYDYKDVANAYGHGEWDAIDKVLEIVHELEQDNIGSEAHDVDYNVACRDIRAAVEALRGGEQEP